MVFVVALAVFAAMDMTTGSYAGICVLLGVCVLLTAFNVVKEQLAAKLAEK